MQNNINNNSVGQSSGFAPRRKHQTKTTVPVINMNDPNQMPNDPSHAMTHANSDCSNNNSGISINENIQQPLDQQETVSRPITHENKQNGSQSSKKLSFEDSLEVINSGGFVMKSAVPLLQEILSRHGRTPNYELVQIEGAMHEPTFRYRVSFNDKDVPFTAMGSGRSKKEAKHSAAKSLIDKLIRIQMIDSQGNNMNTSGSGDGDKVIENSVSLLQEMCMSRRWPLPTYEAEMEVGLPHERLFSIACTILNFREVGNGKSKKIAKRVAAHKMWTRLQETPLGSEETSETMRSEYDSDETYYSGLKDIRVPPINNQNSDKVSRFYRALTNSGGKNCLQLQQLRLADTTIDHIALLSKLAHENEFEITYIDIEEKSFRNEHQCLVEISTLPIGVCHGCGQTILKARMKAAQNALEYLKIMTKK